MRTGGRYNSKYSAVFGFLAVLLVGAVAFADTTIFDFEDAASGSYNPRAGWFAFGAGTSDRGIHGNGASGNGCYHSVDWDEATWGVGDVTSDVVDLSDYHSIRFTARMVDLGDHTGTAKIRFALDLPGGEWTTQSVTVGESYQVFTFAFSAMTGSGNLDLSAGKPKIVLEKNGQSGSTRFDFDEVIAIGAGAITELTAVTLNPPPDGDDVRAMWLYAGSTFSNLTQVQAVLDHCGREGINRVYLGGYQVWAGGTEEEKSLMRSFIETAHQSGIRVEALLDGNDWHENPALVRTRIGQVLDINDAEPANHADDFDAIHFDCEFWLDSSWGGSESSRQAVARDYFDNVLVNARNYLDSNGEQDMKLAVDLSSHFDVSSMLPSAFYYDSSTQYFLEHTLDLVDDVVFMSYYDTATALINVMAYELDLAAGKGRKVQLGADVAPVPPEVSNNSFADNSPNAYVAMVDTLEYFHTRLNSSRLNALDGFSVFHYDYYTSITPNPGNIADMDGDEDVDLNDYLSFLPYLGMPDQEIVGVGRDADLDRDGDVDLADFSLFSRCFTGSGSTGPVPEVCDR